MTSDVVAEERVRDRGHQPVDAEGEARNVAGQRSLAQDAAPVEQVDVAQARRAAGHFLQKLEARPEIGIAGRLAVGLHLVGAAHVGPQSDVGREVREYLHAAHVDVEAGTEQHDVEALAALGRRHLDAILVDGEIGPWLGEAEGKALQPLGAQHRFVRRRRARRQHVGVDLPAPVVVEHALAALETRKRHALGLVDLRQVRPAREAHRLGGAGLERGAGIVDGGRQHAQDADPLAREPGEVDVLQRMEYATLADGILGIERGERGPAEAAGTVAAVGQDDLAGVDGLAGRQRRAQEVAGGFDLQQVDAVLDLQADGLAHPQEIGQPVETGDLVELLPPLGPVLRLVPGAEGEGGDAEVGAGQVLGRAQDRHARRGVPRPLAAMGLALDDPDVADSLAQQAVAHGLAAHAGAHHQHVEGRLAVGPGASGHPVRCGVVQPGEVVLRDLPQRGQTLFTLDNTDHAVLLTLWPSQ